ncbi:MAG: response regulator [Candidatus Cloacimonetes bacterium]|nr:response regulator [Candidatus Cloacimonadota bacterium]
MLNNKSIILIEDDQVDIMAIKRYLKELEITNTLFIFQNGEEFLEFSEQNSHIPVGIILLDLNTPKLNGFEFLDKVKLNQSLNHIPVVVVTTSVEDNDVKQAYRLGAKGYIHKAVDNDDFARALEITFNYWDTQVMGN